MDMGVNQTGKHHPPPEIDLPALPGGAGFGGGVGSDAAVGNADIGQHKARIPPRPARRQPVEQRRGHAGVAQRHAAALRGGGRVHGKAPALPSPGSGWAATSSSSSA